MRASLILVLAGLVGLAGCAYRPGPHETAPRVVYLKQGQRVPFEGVCLNRVAVRRNEQRSLLCDAQQDRLLVCQERCSTGEPAPVPWSLIVTSGVAGVALGVLAGVVASGLASKR